MVFSGYLSISYCKPSKLPNDMEVVLIAECCTSHVSTKQVDLSVIHQLCSLVPLSTLHIFVAPKAFCIQWFMDLLSLHSEGVLLLSAGPGIFSVWVSRPPLLHPPSLKFNNNWRLSVRYSSRILRCIFGEMFTFQTYHLSVIRNVLPNTSLLVIVLRVNVVWLRGHFNASLVILVHSNGNGNVRRQ